MLSFHRAFQINRLTGVKNFLNSLEAAPTDSRLWPESLVLGIISVYIANCLAPPSPVPPLLRTLLRAAAIRGVRGPVLNEEYVQNVFHQGRQLPLLQERGCCFVADVLMQETAVQIFRLPAHYVESHACFAAVAELMGLPSPEALQTAFGRPMAVNNPFPQPNEHRAPYGNTSVYLTSWLGRPPSPVGFPIAHLPQLPRPVRMDGPDILHQVHRPARFEELIIHEDLRLTLYQILFQFVHDVMVKVPVPRKRGKSYLTLSANEHARVTLNMFKQPIVPFTDVSILCTDIQHWNANFDRLFPSRNHQPSHAPSHFPQCLYYQAWLYVLSRLTADAARDVKNVLGTLFDQFSWVPHCDIANLWHTGVHLPSRRWHSLGPATEGPHPRIIANPYIYRSAEQVRDVFSLRPANPSMSKEI